MQRQMHKQWISDPLTRKLIDRLEEEKSRHLRLAIGKAIQAEDIEKIVGHLLSYNVNDSILNSVLTPTLEINQEQNEI